MPPLRSLTIHILQLQNGSYVTGVKGEVITWNRTSSTPLNSYDGDGALMYVIVVILMYSFSIILMIGSSMKKSSNQDHAMQMYLKDSDGVKTLVQKQEKFKAKLMMHNKPYRHILGSDRADITLDQDWFRRHGISPEKRMSISLGSIKFNPRTISKPKTLEEVSVSDIATDLGSYNMSSFHENPGVRMAREWDVDIEDNDDERKQRRGTN